MNNRKAYIYELVDPRNGAVRYVGRCTGSRRHPGGAVAALSSRRSGHEQEAKAGYKSGFGSGLINEPKQKWILDLLSHGLRPQIVLVKEVSYGNRFAERAWIRKKLRDGADLLNVTGRPRQLVQSETVRVMRATLRKLVLAYDRNIDLASSVEEIRNLIRARPHEWKTR